MNMPKSPGSLAPGESCVFYVSSHGLAGDHWFDWLARTLNAHPDVMVYQGESVRSKYLKERSRKERPEIVAFTKFLADLGKPYPAIGECYAYRAYQLEPLRAVYGDRVRFVNVVRHPYCWLRNYVTWRCTNMGMPPGETFAVDHEWNISRHEEFRNLGLPAYGREDIERWATYQGMHILNRMISDKRDGVLNVQLESLVKQPEMLNETVAYLTHGRVAFDEYLTDHVYGWVDTPFRADGRILNSASAEREKWESWEVEAFDRLVGPEARAMFESFGYVL